jgi:hypothetical protein
VSPPTLQDRVLLFLAVMMFGLGIVNVAQSQYPTAYLDFASSALCLAFYR